MKQRSHPLSGFSLIELLVCISIIGLLTSLLLPAVQMAREAARRNQCKNNLKQLALAAHNFEAAHGRLPAGMDFQHVGPLVYMLPFLDQAAYYNEFSFDPHYVYWWQNPAIRPPLQGAPWESFPIPRPPARYCAEGTLPVLLCPSNPSESVLTVLMTITRGTPGTDFTVGLPSDWDLYSGGPGNVILTRNYYGPCAGDWYFDNGKYRGVFRYHSEGKGIRLTDIFDGTSNTLLFGETAGSRVLFDGAPGSEEACLSVATGGCYITDGFDNGSDYTQPNFESEHFGSRHIGIIHFAFADGTVRAIKNSGSLNGGPRFQMMLLLGGYNDGEASSDSE